MGHGQVTTGSIKDARYRRGTYTRSLEQDKFLSGKSHQEEHGFQ